MATTTLYGGAPLPPLAPAADRLEASRGVAGGWNAQHRTTRRAALGVALAFACAGVAALALMTNPAYGFARAERDGAGAAGTRVGGHHASSEGSFDDAVASVSPTPALGAADAAGLLRQLGDALPEPQHARLAALMDAARVMPEATFARLRAAAAAASAQTETDATDVLVRALDGVAAVDELTASVVELFLSEMTTRDRNADDQEHRGVSETALAIGLTRLMDALRRFPAWTDDDARAFERAVDDARAETWRRFDATQPPKFANLGDAAAGSPVVVASADDTEAEKTEKADDRDDASSSFARLNGVKAAPAGGAGAPASFSPLATAPGLAATSALGSRPRRHSEKTDAAWGVGARADAAATRAIREAFDPESVGLPRAFDAREAFPRCAALIGSVRDQGKCGSCWAVAATEVMNDRLCVASGGEKRRELSPQFALSCFDAGSGCDGGDVLATFRETVARGLPYGGMGIETDPDDDAPSNLGSVAAETDGRKKTRQTRQTRETPSRRDAPDVCVPYEFEPCDHPCQVPGTRAAKCPSTCTDGSELELVFPQSDAYTCPPGDWACVAREIRAFGSVAVTFGSVRADFYEHERGVYRVQDVSDPGLGQHATKLIGWGFDEDSRDPYWIMMNSWQNWGEDGAGRVGVGEMNIESGISAVRM